MWSRTPKGQGTAPGTPNSGKNKRGRQAIISPESTNSQAQTKSPEGQAPKRLMMPPESQIKSTPIDLETMKSLLAPIKKQLSDLKDSMEKAVKSMGKMQTEIRSVKNDLEGMRRQLLAKTVVIYGLEEKPNESFKDIEQKIAELAAVMEMPNLDYDIARRMGKPLKGKYRPVELTLLRQRDKFAILTAKSKLGGNDETKMVYINQARTRQEQRKCKKLMEYAKNEKSIDEETKYRFIRGQILEIQNGKAKGQYYVDDEDKVQDYNNKRGNPVERQSQGEQPFRSIGVGF